MLRLRMGEVSRSLPRFVMAGLGPAIHALQLAGWQDVDARDERGHDEVDGPPRSRCSDLNVMCGRPPRVKLFFDDLSVRERLRSCVRPLLRPHWPLASMEFAMRVPDQTGALEGA